MEKQQDIFQKTTCALLQAYKDKILNGQEVIESAQKMSLTDLLATTIDEQKNTFAHIAAQKGDESFLHMLLIHKASIDRFNNKMQTARMIINAGMQEKPNHFNDCKHLIDAHRPEGFDFGQVDQISDSDDSSKKGCCAIQ